MNSPVGVGTNRRLWLSSIALAFFFLTVGISDVRGGGEEEEDTWNYFYNDDDAITDHPKYLETRGKYFDLISKEMELSTVQKIQKYADLFARVELDPDEYDTVENAFFLYMCSWKKSDEIFYPEEMPFSIPSKHFQRAREIAQHKQQIILDFPELLKPLMKSIDETKLVAKITPEDLASLFSGVLVDGIDHPTSRRAADAFTTFRWYCNSVADIPDWLFKYSSPQLKSLVKSYDKWYRRLSKSWIPDVDDGVAANFMQTFKARNSLRALGRAATQLGDLELENCENSEEKALALLSDFDELKLKLEKLNFDHNFLKTDAMEKARKKYSTSLKTKKEARKIVHQLIMASDLEEWDIGNADFDKAAMILGGFDRSDPDANTKLFQLANFATTLKLEPRHVKPAGVTDEEFEQAQKCSRLWQETSELRRCKDKDAAAKYIRNLRLLRLAGLPMKEYKGRPSMFSFTNRSWGKLVKAEMAKPIDQKILRDITMKKQPAKEEPHAEQPAKAKPAEQPAKEKPADQPVKEEPIASSDFSGTNIAIAGILTAIGAALVGGGIMAYVRRSKKKNRRGRKAATATTAKLAEPNETASTSAALSASTNAVFSSTLKSKRRGIPSVRDSRSREGEAADGKSDVATKPTQPTALWL
eukprot:GHVT01061973.1.p1 GENE.GHVT01061973.1~~GHVT01061973.1.p1  ORF type:complete len:644 (+),score=103.12 GHVT01061973.1:176-2107(+)